MNCERKLIVLLLASVFCHNLGVKGQGSITNRVIRVHKTSTKMNVDGMLEETAWQMASVADSFINKWPTDNGRAKLQTEIRIVYDESFIYFGIKAERSDKDLVIQSLKRDVNPYYSDGVSVVLDPSDKNTSGYTFGVNAAGAQMEGIVEVNSASFDWDSKWYSAAREGKDFWTAELAIPFKSFRFPKNQTVWGINFIRNDMTNNSFSTWNQVPIQFFGANLNCLGKIELVDGVPEVKSNNSFIPYISARLDQNENKAISSSLNAGIDAKIALNSSMNLDATINPDFSQVDVDKQIINLERFNVLIPEKRTFFLENSDLFSKMGIPDAAPFISRKIGLTDDGSVVPIIAGLRLTGNVNPSLRIGLMNIQTARKNDQLPQNYTVAAFDHKLFRHSNILGLFTNREEINGNTKLIPGHEFNRVAGTELNLLSNNTKFSSRMGYYQSFNPGNLKSSGFGFASAGYTNKKLNISAGWTKINTNFIADLGFTPRLYNYDAAHDTTIRIGYSNYSGSLDYSIYPASKKRINSMDFSIRANQYYSSSGQFIEFNGTTGFDILFANRNEAQVSWTQNRVNLPFATNLFPETGSLEKGGYAFGFASLKFLSSFLKPFSWGLTVEHGGYYNGNRTTISGTAKYRLQPWGNFGVDFIYNDITLNGINIHPYIIGPTVELAFSNNLFWTTFLQYNTQIKNFNLNSRFQWRFKPLSDIFLVYTDNYFTDDWVAKGRSIVFKISYWIN